QFGEEVYGYLVALKQAFDPNNLLNPGVIIGDMPITQHLRADRVVQKSLKTGFDWRNQISLLDAVEKCNGAGACRKSAGRGVMCPSYQATRDDQYSTRGRSNLLRIALTEADPLSALSHAELQRALDLCLGCKACYSECPASVDMAKLKSEVLYQTQRKQPVLQQLSMKHYGLLLSWGAKWPALFNWVQRLGVTKRVLGVDTRRTLPTIQAFDVAKWWRNQPKKSEESIAQKAQRVWVLCDLFSLKQEPDVAKATLSCLNKLGFEVRPIYLQHSPRVLISQGLLTEAKVVLGDIVAQLEEVASEDRVIGMEPSELLVWRDEVRSLLPMECTKYAWLSRSKPVLLFEELIQELAQQAILPALKKIPPPYEKVWLHVHCHQKALAQPQDTKTVLQLIPGLKVEVIASGCCGMSGDFGYKHYDVSQKIAEQSLLPALKQVQSNDVIVATGTSCRHQIQDFGGKKSRHIAELFDWVL
ncbi:Fe-S protein, homolog of lactate dehydrogenase SO1521, partial [hydrothermal vent metagenome]